LLHSKSPYELLYHKSPSLSHLKVFGCLCYATVVKHKPKFDSRAKRSIFVGYPTGQKSYKLYDLETKQFFVSRDIKFSETIFPFSLVTPTSTSFSPQSSSSIFDNWSSPSSVIKDVSSPQPQSIRRVESHEPRITEDVFSNPTQSDIFPSNPTQSEIISSNPTQSENITNDNLANPNQLVQNPTSDETLESVPVTLEDVVPSSPLLRQFARLKKTPE